MNSSKKVAGILLLGFLLQVSCASLASLFGICPIDNPQNRFQTVAQSEADVPPCHADRSSQRESSESESGDCCQKDFTASSEDSILRVSLDKLKMEIVSIPFFLPLQTKLETPSFRRVLADRNGSFSKIRTYSFLQVFLI
ncbi:hypothetical protein EHO61_08560 [Leptospira fluminis]|uniref:Lipoprotein n=1 Tax=Leptospira fluminis TaxID=2484979 RepID=A0A4R9GQN6_9LEPT|nr:hypothetical protein [Leptospira fluminis]TGK18951.1 hypothetical protein EHO61_08560 [Leptospira fluminis]